MFNPKVFVAEFIGTFALVFVGAAAGLYNVGWLGISLAHGLTVAAFFYVYGHISGMHVNPAVTLGLAVNGTIKWVEAIVYWVAQFSGAVLAAFLLGTFVSLIDTNAVTAMATNGVLTASHPYYAMGLEALLAFFLVNAVLHTAVDGRAGAFAGLAIGLTYTIAILAGGPLTGGSFNPARTLGPATFTSAIDATRPDYQNPMLYLIYFVGPFFGSIVAVLFYRFFKMDFGSREEVEEMEIVEIVEEVVVDEPVKRSVRKPAARKPTTRKTKEK